MSDDYLWKERLAFISGNVLVFGLFVLTYWPIVSRFQTGMHIHSWTTNLPGEGVKSEFWIFIFMTTFLALAISITSLAIVHIICRGAWLTIPIKEDQESVLSSLGNLLNRLCYATYLSIFVLGIYVCFTLFIDILVLLSSGLEWLLAPPLSISAAGWISRGGVILLTLVLRFIVLKKIHFRNVSFL